jgi:hypothetical protein
MRSLAVAALALAVAAAPAPARADDAPPAWEVRIPDTVDVVVEVAATVSLTVTPGNGRTISRDGPLRVALASDTLTLPRRRYGRDHAVDPAADAPRLELKLTAPAAGDHALAIDVAFWLCGPKACRPVRVRRTVTVRAAPPAPPAPPPVSDAPDAGAAR